MQDEELLDLLNALFPNTDVYVYSAEGNDTNDTFYRDLKYPVDLLHFHGKSAEFVLQEIFCSLTMFNFCAYLCVHADILCVSKDSKYRYKVNFANAVGPCRSYLLGCIGELELLDRLKLAPSPIRPDRHVPRPPRLKEQSSREFNYRVS